MDLRSPRFFNEFCFVISGSTAETQTDGWDFFPYQTLVGGAALSALKATEQLHLLNLQISQVFLQFNHLHWYEILVVKFCLNTYTLTCRYYCIICEIVLQDIANNKVPQQFSMLLTHREIKYFLQFTTLRFCTSLW